MSNSGDQIAIQVQNVSAGYGGAPILHDLTFDIACGRSTVILGANGCGKTTLLRALTGLIPYDGDIRILDKKMSRMKRREIACAVSMMSQLSPVYFTYSIRETVELGRYARQKTDGISAHDREVVDRCLELTGLSAIQNSQIGALSGGQLQRVFLARTLSQETPIILLDEPTNHLDLKYQAELMKFLTDWSHQTTTMPDGREVPNTLIGVFHDISLAVRAAQDMIFLKDGHILQKGPKDVVLTSQLLEEAYGIDVAGYMRQQGNIWERI